MRDTDEKKYAGSESDANAVTDRDRDPANGDAAKHARPFTDPLAARNRHTDKSQHADAYRDAELEMSDQKQAPLVDAQTLAESKSRDFDLDFSAIRMSEIARKRDEFTGDVLISQRAGESFEEAARRLTAERETD